MRHVLPMQPPHSLPTSQPLSTLAMQPQLSSSVTIAAGLAGVGDHVPLVDISNVVGS